MSGFPRPSLLCSTVSMFSAPLDRAFGLVADAGFDGIEIMVAKDPDTQDPERLQELSEDHGLPVLAVHAPFLLVTRSVWGRDPVGKIERAVALAADVGAPLVVVHPPYRWQAGYRRWLSERPADDGGSAIVVAVENMFPLRIGGRKLGHLHAGRPLEDVEGFPMVALDTSHLAVAGLDPVETATSLGDRLAHVHLSNNAGRGWDSHLPIDDGVLDLERFLETLAARDYRGAISLELDLRDHLDDDRALRRALAHNRALCATALSSTA